MKLNNIFFDLDGVFRDWDAGVLKHFNLDAPFGNEPRGWYDILTYLVEETGLPSDYIWGRSFDDEFWAGLPITSEFDSFKTLLDHLLSDAAVGVGPAVTILTSPGPIGATGTQRWLEKHLPGVPYLIGNNKGACADERSLLIDDRNKNCIDFELAGGFSILVPRPWNALHFCSHAPYQYVRYEMEKMGVIG